MSCSRTRAGCRSVAAPGDAALRTDRRSLPLRLRVLGGPRATAPATGVSAPHAHPPLAPLRPQLARHPAVVVIPYTKSVMTFFEMYRMNIPMFAPSLSLLVSWEGRHSVRFGRPPQPHAQPIRLRHAHRRAKASPPSRQPRRPAAPMQVMAERIYWSHTPRPAVQFPNTTALNPNTRKNYRARIPAVSRVDAAARCERYPRCRRVSGAACRCGRACQWAANLEGVARAMLQGRCATGSRCRICTRSLT